MTFSILAGNPISDEEFAQRKHIDMHRNLYKTNKIDLEVLGVGMISQFPLDCMHLLDLGVTKKLILSLVNRKTKTKQSAASKLEISVKLNSIVKYIPKEFCRKPRGLDDVQRWKATEYRQFVLYTGILVFKNLVSDDFYYHFLLLHCAYRLLSQSYLSNIKTAQDLLDYFV